MNDTLESILDESGDEEEQDAIVNQVLDEIGIEISGKVCGMALRHYCFFQHSFLVLFSLQTHFLCMVISNCYLLSGFA